MLKINYTLMKLFLLVFSWNIFIIDNFFEEDNEAWRCNDLWEKKKILGIFLKVWILIVDVNPT